MPITPDCIPLAARGSAGNRQPALLPVIASGGKPRGNPVFQFKHEHMFFSGSPRCAREDASEQPTGVCFINKLAPIKKPPQKAACLLTDYDCEWSSGYDLSTNLNCGHDGSVVLHWFQFNPKK